MSDLLCKNTSRGRCWSTTPSSTSDSGCWSRTGTLWLSGCTNLHISGHLADLLAFSQSRKSLILDSVLSLIKWRISTSPSTCVTTRYSRNTKMGREAPTCPRRTCGTTTPSSTTCDRSKYRLPTSTHTYFWKKYLVDRYYLRYVYIYIILII